MPVQRNDDQPAGSPADRVMIRTVCPLYVAFGFSLGLVQIALPSVLQREGLPLEQASLLALLFLPFGLAVLWAPIVDRYRIFGQERRVGWVVLCQVIVIGSQLAAGLVGPQNIALVVVAMAVMALAAATMDTALDGYVAVTSQSRQFSRRGGAKIGSMYLGTILGSTFALMAIAHAGWFAVLSCGAALGLAALANFVAAHPAESASDTTKPAGWKPPLRLGVAVRRKAPVIILIGCTLGMGAAMPRLLLVDRQMDLAAIGLIFGPVSLAAGMLGAIAGGELGRAKGIPSMLRAAACLFGGAMIAMAMIAMNVIAISGMPGQVSASVTSAAITMAAAGLAYGGVFAGVSALALGWAKTDQPSTDYAMTQSLWYTSIIVGSAAGGSLLGMWGAAAFPAAAIGVGLGILLLTRHRDAPSPATGDDTVAAR